MTANYDRGNELRVLGEVCICTVFLAMLSIANGAQVVLTSDPPGSVISIEGREMGMTPLTLDLSAGQPVEITSRFGPLGEVVHTLTPADGQIVAYQFKHEYSTLVVMCDRTDAALVIDGVGYGRPPAIVLVSPGRHKLFMTASNAPDKTREVEVQAGERATVEMYFSGGSPETKTTSAGPRSSPEASPSATASPIPRIRGVKPSPTEPRTVVWQEPPPLIPSPSPAGNSRPPPPTLHRKSVVNTAEKVSTSLALVSMASKSGGASRAPTVSATPDKVKARAVLKELWRSKDQVLQAEKAQIKSQIKNSTGAVREQWKYKLAVWQEKLTAAKQEEAAAEAALK